MMNDFVSRSSRLGVLFLLALAMLLPAATAMGQSSCPCDCSEDGMVPGNVTVSVTMKATRYCGEGNTVVASVVDMSGDVEICGSCSGAVIPIEGTVSSTSFIEGNCEFPGDTTEDDATGVAVVTYNSRRVHGECQVRTRKQQVLGMARSAQADLGGVRAGPIVKPTKP